MHSKTIGIVCWQHAVGYVTNGEYYGAKALLNVWAPNVVGYDFSISQIWVMTDVLTRDVNTVEAGWHVSATIFFFVHFY